MTTDDLDPYTTDNYPHFIISDDRQEVTLRSGKFDVTIFVAGSVLSVRDACCLAVHELLLSALSNSSESIHRAITDEVFDD